MTCQFCHEELEQSEALKHIADCQHAPEEIRTHVQSVIASRKAYAEAPIIYCKMRKKVRMRPFVYNIEDCGISDAEMADFMTFEQFQGVEVIMPKFCPWCGKPWKRTGLNVV